MGEVEGGRKVGSMRAVIQRVASARVTVDGAVTGQIGQGLLVLVAVHKNDTESSAEWLAKKVIALRLFCDEEGKMNRSLSDIQGQLLVVSQFTLYADCRHGRRPSYSESAPPERAEALYQAFLAALERLGHKAETGVFRAHMLVSLENDGPVTITVDSP